MKILSPVGNLDSLKVAIYNGADEIYLGLNSFNARNNIDGFDLEKLKIAVNFAHLYNVKVNLAINILFSNDELQSAVDTIVDAYNLGVDYFIVQDLGLATIILKNYPQIILHASTQMGVHNLEGVLFLQKLGFKRVVLARETPLKEIKRIKENSNIEIEYFVQGALCVSFSGNCYLSSYLCNASGNRGKCKQLCRLPYSFEKDGKIINKGFLLSAKDFDMRSKLKELQDSGVDVIKIEGRARRPGYVGLATREYFNILNGIKPNNDNILLGFNRDYTQGYFNGNDKIISKYNNHIGKEIGKVAKFNKGKKFNEIIISSNQELNEKSTFKFFDNDKEVSTITAYDLKKISKNEYMITSTQMVKVGNKVNLIVDRDLENEVLNYIKKIPVNIEIWAFENNPIKAKIFVQEKSFVCEGANCEVAQKSPLTQLEIEDNFKKSEYFEANLIIHLGNVFLPKSKLNEFRRNVFETIEQNLTQIYCEKIEKIKVDTSYKVKYFDNFEIVEDVNQSFKSKNIVYSPEKYDEKDIENFVLKCKKENRKAFLDTPNFALMEDIILLKNIIEKTKISIIANNYYALNFDTEIVIGGFLNVYNNVTAQFYDKPIICAESEVSTNIKLPYMTLRHCPIKTNLKCDCKTCKYSNNCYYIMENGKRLKIKRKKLNSCTFYLVD